VKLAITSLGIVSSVGLDVETSCAAIRAKMSRPAPLVGTGVLDGASGQLIPVVGHPLRGVSDGFSSIGLWVRLAHGAIADAIRYGAVPPEADRRFWEQCHMMLVVPAMDPGRFSFVDEEDPNPAPVLSAYLESLLALTGLPVRREHVQTFSAGHTGVAQALTLAAEEMASGRLERCLIVAVDSYVEAGAIDWLASRGRLKSGDNPVGLSPGEGASAVLVESAQAARNRGARVEAWVRSVNITDSPGDDDASLDHFLLADALAAALPPDRPYRGGIITDANGEAWRAQQLGHALTRLGGQLGDFDVLYPAASLGDTGAAAAAIGLCMAARAFRRRYARSNNMVVLSLSDRRQASGIRLECE
jgi:3-oxoacyl-[acyl-carrier-protein] synthase-1